MAKNSKPPISAHLDARVWQTGVTVAACVLLGLAWWLYLRPSRVASLAPAPTPILSSSTAELPAGHVTPPRALVDALYQDTMDENLANWFEACRRDKGLQHLPVEQWFVSVQLPAISGHPPMYFVRPALEPYCQTFYGAHAFSYWLVQQQPTALGSVFKVVDADGADVVNVLPTHHGGIYDMERGRCTAMECTYVTQQLQGESFRFVNCRREHFDDGKLLRTEPLECDALLSD